MLLIVLANSACFRKDEYIGIVYPEKENLLNSRVIGNYENLEECLSEARRRSGESGACECGKNCVRDKSPMVCEETFD